jgi:hypothetical protein
VLGVFATVLTAYRGSTIGIELSGIEQGIEKLGKRADLVFVTFTSDVPEVAVGKPALFNITFRNIGNAVANNATGLGRVYIVPDVKDETQREAIAKFRSEWAKERDSQVRGAIQPGGHDLLIFSARGERPITDTDMAALKDGSEYLMILTIAEFEDVTGQHYIHRCEWVQAPAFAPLMIDFCVGFNEQN